MKLLRTKFPFSETKKKIHSHIFYTHFEVGFQISFFHQTIV